MCIRDRYHVGLLNDCDFDDICISIKSSSVPNTMQAYLLASEKTDYPLHLGAVSYTHLDVYKRQPRC